MQDSLPAFAEDFDNEASDFTPKSDQDTKLYTNPQNCVTLSTADASSSNTAPNTTTHIEAGTEIRQKFVIASGRTPVKEIFYEKSVLRMKDILHQYDTFQDKYSTIPEFDGVTHFLDQHRQDIRIGNRDTDNFFLSAKGDSNKAAYKFLSYSIIYIKALFNSNEPIVCDFGETCLLSFWQGIGPDHVDPEYIKQIYGITTAPGMTVDEQNQAWIGLKEWVIRIFHFQETKLLRQ